MATIVFVMRFQRGHLNPLLTLARAVRERGHRVICVSLVDVEEHVRAYGLEFRAFAPDLLPKGLTTSRREASPRSSAGRRLIQPLVTLARFRAYEALVYERFRDGELVRVLDGTSPDLFLVDSLLTVPGLAAMATGVRTALVNTMLPIGFDPGVPPSTSAHVPDGSLVSALRIHAAWAWRWCVPRLQTLGPALLRAPYPGGLTFGRHVREYAARIGASPYLEPGCFGLHLRLPELTFGPEELDLPGRRRPELRYIEAGIDLSRPQPLLAWEDSVDGRRLVYCSLGTLDGALALPTRLRFYRSVFQALAARPDLFGLVVSGSTDPSVLAPVPANVRLVAQAPQLRVLGQASLMITHGGTASVRECLYHGVPMVVLPFGSDPFGNAARVVFHRFGLADHLGRLSAGRLGSMMGAILDDGAYAARLHEVSAIVRARERSGIGVAAVEALLAHA